MTIPTQPSQPESAISSGQPVTWPPDQPLAEPGAQTGSTAPVTDTWASRKKEQLGVVCPSGQPVKVRRLGIQGLIRAGVLKSADTLTALVQDKHLDRVKGKAVVDNASLMENPAKVQEALDTIYRIVCYAVIDPKLAVPPAEEDQRDPEVLYADEIDMEDIMFLLNYVLGGSKDLERFRRELDESIRDLDNGETSEVST